MGCGISVSKCKLSEEVRNHSDDQLQTERKKTNTEVKFLLLGAGESGKSTIVKQMKIIHCDGYSLEERMEFRQIVHSNTIQSLVSILTAMKKLNIQFSNISRVEDSDLFISTSQFSTVPEITFRLEEIMERLWQDEGVQRCFSNYRHYQINDSAAYFLNELKRISDPEYVPSVQDILNTRMRTLGITCTEFFYKNLAIEFIDVGGQRSERMKWLRCFVDVSAIIFCIALSEYDLVLEEHADVNRMVESMNLFDRICNNRLFPVTSIIVFFNKEDIFKKKIKHSPLEICFPEFEGPNSYEVALPYIKDKFLSLKNNKSELKKNIFSHITCATDTENITHVFNVATEVIITSNQEACRFV